MKTVVSGALLALALAGMAAAHRLDEYLQATLIDVTPSGVEVSIRLTPGVAVLPAVLAVIDRDCDGRISVEEERAYAGRVLRDVELRIDGRPAALSLIGSRFSPLADMRQGMGAIELKLRTDRTGHELRFENRHLPQVSAYLVNCLAPGGAGIALGPPRRDPAQASIAINYSGAGGAAAPRSAALWFAALGIILLVRLAAHRYPWRRNASAR